MLPFLAEADLGTGVDLYWKGFQVCAVLLLCWLFYRKLPKTVSDEVKRHTGYPSDHAVLVKLEKRTTDMSRRMTRLQERVIKLPGDLASSIAEDIRQTIREDIGGIIKEAVKPTYDCTRSIHHNMGELAGSFDSLNKAVVSRYDTFLDDWQKTALSLSNIELSLTYVRAGLSGPVHSTSDGAELPEGNLWKSIENLRSWLQDDLGSVDNLWTKLNDIHQWTGWQHDADEAVKKAEDALFEESKRAGAYEVLIGKIKKLGDVYDDGENTDDMRAFRASVQDLLEKGIEAITIKDHLIHNTEKYQQDMADAIDPELWDGDAKPPQPEKFESHRLDWKTDFTGKDEYRNVVPGCDSLQQKVKEEHFPAQGLKIIPTEKLIPDELSSHPDVGLEQNEKLAIKEGDVEGYAIYSDGDFFVWASSAEEARQQLRPHERKPIDQWGIAFFSVDAYLAEERERSLPGIYDMHEKVVLSVTKLNAAQILRVPVKEQPAPEHEPECGKCGVLVSHCLCPKDAKPYVSEKDCDEYLASLPEGTPTESKGLAGFRLNVDKALMEKASQLQQDIAEALKPAMDAFRKHGEVTVKMGDHSITVVRCAGCGKMVEKKEGDCEPYFCVQCEYDSTPIPINEPVEQAPHEEEIHEHVCGRCNRLWHVLDEVAEYWLAHDYVCPSCEHSDGIIGSAANKLEYDPSDSRTLLDKRVTTPAPSQALIETEDDIELAPIIESDDDVWIGPLTPWTNGEHLVMARSADEAVEIAQAEHHDTLVTKPEDWKPVPGGNGEKLNVRYKNGITFEGTVSSIANLERGYVGTIVKSKPSDDLLKEASKALAKDASEMYRTAEFRTTMLRLAKADLERVDHAIEHNYADPSLAPEALKRERKWLEDIITECQKED